MTVSIRTRFLLLFGAIFLLGGVISYRFVVWYSDDIVTALGSRLVERNTLYGKSQIQRILTREVTLAQKMASSPVLKQWIAKESDAERRAQAVAELEDFRHIFRNQSYFFAIARSGNYYYNDEKGGHDTLKPRYTLSESIQKDGWFYATLRHVKDVQLNVDTDRHLGITRVWINVVVRNTEGQAIAVTGSGINLSDVILSVIKSREDDVTNMLLNENGAIQAHQDVSMIDFASVRKDTTQEERRTIFQLLDTPADADALRSALTQLISGDQSVITLPLTIQGRRQLTGITWVPDIRWFVVTMAHPRAVSASAHLPSTLLGLAIALLVVLLVAALIIERTVVRRISRLDIAARNLSEGQHKQPIGDTSADEIGRLTRTFDVMAKRIMTHTDTLERQVAERTATLESIAHTDFLTGCLNRRGMMTQLANEKSRLSRLQQKLGVLIVDVDHFKLINDRWGHTAGDVVLTNLAAVLKENVRTYDAVARWGGEEFLIGLFGLHNQEELELIAQKLLAATRSATFIAEGLHIKITISIGAIMASPDDDLDRILSEADKALYVAKTDGRDRIVMAGQEVKRSAS